VSDDNDVRGKPAPSGAKPAAKAVPGIAGLPDPNADASDLERTRELPPGSRIASSWPRPTPKGPASGSTVPRPAVGGDLFPGLSGLTQRSSRPPKAEANQPFQPAPAPLEAPPPPGVPVEEISNSLLLPDDSGAVLSPEPEELSGSVLVEDAPDGRGPPVVTALGSFASQASQAAHAAPGPAAEPVEAAHRALLGMPRLPTSTPAPVIAPRNAPAGKEGAHGGPADHGGAQAPLSDEPMHTDAPPVRVVELPAEQGAPETQEPYAYPANGYDEARLPTSGLGAAMQQAAAQAKALLRRARGALLASANEQQGARPPWTLPAVTLAGLVVGIGVVGLLFTVLGKHRGGTDESATSGSAPSGSARTAAPALSASSAGALAPAPAVVPAPSASTSASACKVTASSQIVAPGALVSAGVEVRPFGDAVALGFAPSEHEARALRIDPVTLAASGGVASHGSDVIRRVRPAINPKNTLGLAVDAERKHDRVQGRRTLPIDPPLQVGSFDGGLVWTRAGGGPAGKLWPLSGSDDVDALRAASEGAPGDTTTAIAFRRSNEIWVGVATGYRALTPKGDLSHVAGLGPSVGSPAVAVNDGAVVVAWSDRPSTDAPWHLRMVHLKAGEAASEPTTFSPPSGGPGGHAMSPSLAPIPGGRFLLVWTEGPTSQQRVRAVTLTASGEPVGKPLEISNETVNSGQGQAAVTATSGAAGIVAFLQAADGAFEVAVTGIGCD
jgi:hypothetical protein